MYDFDPWPGIVVLFVSCCTILRFYRILYCKGIVMSIAVNQQRVRAAKLNNGQIRRVYTNNVSVFEQAGNLPVIQAFSVAPESQNRSTFATGDQITLAWECIRRYGSIRQASTETI